jgi:hypothetical protein
MIISNKFFNKTKRDFLVGKWMQNDAWWMHVFPLSKFTKKIVVTNLNLFFLKSKP